VVAAHQVAVAEESKRQGRAAMRAKVLHRRHLAALPAIENDFFTADLAAQGPAFDLVRRTRHIPGIFWNTIVSFVVFIIFSTLNVEKVSPFCWTK
jgi:hypothetical protein